MNKILAALVAGLFAATTFAASHAAAPAAAAKPAAAAAAPAAAPAAAAPAAKAAAPAAEMKKEEYWKLQIRKKLGYYREGETVYKLLSSSVSPLNSVPGISFTNSAFM